MPSSGARRRTLGVHAQPAEAKTVEEIDLAFAAMGKERPGALIVFPDPLFNGNRVRVAALAERYRLPWLTHAVGEERPQISSRP
jgi:hypothetical protein